jgi:hypothetical protein
MSKPHYKICIFEDCNTPATFNYEGEHKRLYCAEHKYESMVYISQRSICAFEGCTKNPSYNFANEKGRYCAKHKTDEMVNVQFKLCEHEDCNIQASFNYEGENKKLYCNTHKLFSMVNVSKRSICAFEGCAKTPSYKLENEKEKYCVTHKTDEMVKMYTKKLCEHSGCTKQPKFNLPGCKTGVRCMEHCLEDMINVHAQMCQHIGCQVQATYTLSGMRKPMYCFHHHLPGMISVGRKCESDGCDKAPSFNEKGNKIPRFCANHKEIGMINVFKRCLHEGCDSSPVYNYPGLQTLYCKLHKKDLMVNVVPFTTCSMCPSKENKNLPKKGYCSRCFIYTFPEEKVARHFKVKEQHVREFIQQEFEQYNTIFDKTIRGGCSQKRPDAFIDMLVYSIIIEVDEGQHDRYSCENKRMMELFQDLGQRPIVFIRFNPDKYINSENETVESCFKYHKQMGVPVIKNKTLWNNRLQELKSKISYHIANIPDKEITIEYLYYDH